MLTAKVQKTKVGSPSAKALLLALANFADDEGASCFPGQHALQEITELSLDTIQRQLKFLIEGGFVTAEKSRRKGHWASWDYRINLEKLVHQAALCGTADQAAPSGTVGDDQAAPCGTAKPQDAARPSRTMRPYPSNKPFKEPSRAREPSRPDGLGSGVSDIKQDTPYGDECLRYWREKGHRIPPCTGAGFYFGQLPPVPPRSTESARNAA
ncbi:hypothetical protein GGD66_000839 [Bradyrhizobium sp. CIR48]|uniref:helix-turn-helix domain-containing protein n=1 Tax=Bradyrhizobium sp. CIR48 TaxID=2663840 RepID=UPI0016064A00|nr:helix-turn-helix domain-containing protein [Bradyrhizobium sp. CIR48]MBB4422313.1 hypothetical protein [Bradyrhizobium sp. CIR48]